MSGRLHERERDLGVIAGALDEVAVGAGRAVGVAVVEAAEVLQVAGGQQGIVRLVHVLTASNELVGL
jgi:hypothetical protein